MNKKIIVILPLWVLLSGCNTMQYFKQPVQTDVDNFWNNPRIVFKDVTIPLTRYHNYQFKKKTYPLNKKITYSKNTYRTVANQATYKFTKDEYGSSLNDPFNGATKPPLISVPDNQLSSTNQPIVAAPNVMPPYRIANPKSANPIDKPPTNSPPSGTNYVPLTFPVPPPQAMMQQFHMKIGSSSSDVSNS